MYLSDIQTIYYYDGVKDILKKLIHNGKKYLSTGLDIDDINNMKPLEGHYNLITTESPRCAEIYKDKSIDFVFIDGDHSYDAVIKDIKAWLPKIKTGGILSGHDYEIPSVKKACHDVLGERNLEDPWKEGCWMLKTE